MHCGIVSLHLTVSPLPQLGETELESVIDRALVIFRFLQDKVKLVFFFALRESYTLM